MKQKTVPLELVEEFGSARIKSATIALVRLFAPSTYIHKPEHQMRLAENNRVCPATNDKNANCHSRPLKLSQLGKKEREKSVCTKPSICTRTHFASLPARSLISTLNEEKEACALRISNPFIKAIHSDQSIHLPRLFIFPLYANNIERNPRKLYSCDPSSLFDSI